MGVKIYDKKVKMKYIFLGQGLIIFFDCLRSMQVFTRLVRELL